MIEERAEESDKAAVGKERFVGSILYILKCELSMAKSTVTIYRTQNSDKQTEIDSLAANDHFLLFRIQE